MLNGQQPRTGLRHPSRLVDRFPVNGTGRMMILASAFPLVCPQNVRLGTLINETVDTDRFTLFHRLKTSPLACEAQ